LLVPTLKPVDESFFDSAHACYRHRWSLGRPAFEMWEELVGDRPLHWCRGLAINWTSPRPFSLGSTREAKALGGMLRVHERFFVWEEGRRYAFYVTGANAPLFKSFAEDYIVQPDGPNRCTFTWKIALEPTALGKLAGPVNSLLFKSFFKDTTRYFAAS
jgi:hypothetical protein